MSVHQHHEQRSLRVPESPATGWPESFGQFPLVSAEFHEDAANGSQKITLKLSPNPRNKRSNAQQRYISFLYVALFSD